MDTAVGTEWWSWRDARPAATLRLFCFAHAGGSAAAYRTWSGTLPSSVEVIPVELPGHGQRHTERAIGDWPTLLGALWAGLGHLFDKPFAFFGHSLGGRIAFELTRELRRRDAKMPFGLFVSAANAPHLPGTRPRRHTLSRAALVDELRYLGGTPEAVLQSDDMLDFFLPTLRADFALVDDYVYRDEEKLSLPLMLFAGRRDKEVPLANVEAWRSQTSGATDLRVFDAPHLFLDSERAAILSIIDDRIATWSRPGAPPTS